MTDIESYKLHFIEDWKNEEKIQNIKNLILSQSINRKTLLYIIGKQSKKTYQNGEIIDDKSLSLRKFFDTSYKEKLSEFYTRFDDFKERLQNTGVDQEIIDSSTHEIIKFIQTNTLCQKYNETELAEYKTKITDIIDTRYKEKEIFELFNQIAFDSFIHLPNHEAFKYLINKGWNDTKEKYRWLTELITFINNGSQDSKEFLISIFNLKPIQHVDIQAKKLLIKLVSQKMKLSRNYIHEINDFLFSMGNFYKHGTYYKWYCKELEYIQFFETHKHQSVSSLLEQLPFPAQYIDELTFLLDDYQSLLNQHFLL